MKKIAIITTHPIQYNAPFFKKLAESFELKVFYTWGQAKNIVYDPGFGRERMWDIPLLEGYNYTFVNNVSSNPGSHHFRGIINPTLIDEINEYGAEVLLIYGWSFKSHLKAIIHFYKKKIILFRGDSTLLDEKKGLSLKKIARTLFLRWLYKKIDYALYTGEANKDYFIKYGVKKNKLFYAPHAVDNERFFDTQGIWAVEAEKWRQELGVQKSQIVILYAGKLEPKKDPEILLKAFMKCAALDAKLIYVGNGVLENKLKNMAKEDKRIIFLPFQNQLKMPVVYRLGNIFVLPSIGPGETWGLAVNEAMACERGIIVSDKCGCAVDLVKNEINGHIFGAGDLQSLEMILLKIYENRGHIESMGNESGRIIKRWQYKLSIETIISILRNS